MDLVKTTWLAILTGTDEESLLNFSELLMMRAVRQRLSISVVMYDNVADARLGIQARKPFVVSITPDLRPQGNAGVEKWSGLDLLNTTSELKIPAIVLGDYTSKQLRGALSGRRITARPEAIINPYSAVAWTEAVLTQLMTRQQ